VFFLFELKTRLPAYEKRVPIWCDELMQLMFPVYRHGEWGTAVRAARHGTVSRVPVNGHDNSERSFSAQRQGPLHEHVTRVDDSTGCNGAHAATT